MRKIVVSGTLTAIFIVIVGAFFLVTKGSSDGYVTDVHNVQELQTALKNKSKVVNLDNDIYYGDSDFFYISSNVIINGQGHAMIDTGSQQTNYNGFTLTTSNLKVNYRNLNFGDGNGHDNQSWYGILQGSNHQVDLVLDGVHYYGDSAAQPFFLNNSSTVTFLNNNSFKVAKGSGNGQEFIQGGATLLFDTGSNTTIEHYSSDSTSAFWWPNNAVNLIVRGTVNIKTNKPQFVYGATVAMDVQKDGYLSIANTERNLSLSTTSGAARVAQNGTLKFQSNGPINNSGGTFGIATANPRSISFENTGSSGRAFNTTFVIQNYLGNSGNQYVLDATPNPNGIAYDNTTSTTGANQLTPSRFPSTATKVEYRPIVSLTANIGTTVTNVPMTSQINISNPQATSGTNASSISKLRYKIYDKPLTSSVDGIANQQKITNADGAVYAGETSDNAVSIDKVTAGDYYVYVQADSDMGTTSWIMKKVTVQKTVLSITVPITTSFKTESNAPFQSNDTYSIVNNSNYAVNYAVNGVTSNQSDVALVDSITSSTPNSAIYLGLRDTHGTELPFTGKSSRKINIGAFGGTSNFNIVGQYKGPIRYGTTDKLIQLKYELKLVFN